MSIVQRVVVNKQIHCCYIQNRNPRTAGIFAFEPARAKLSHAPSLTWPPQKTQKSKIAHAERIHRVRCYLQKEKSEGRARSFNRFVVRICEATAFSRKIVRKTQSANHVNTWKYDDGDMVTFQNILKYHAVFSVYFDLLFVS